MRDCADIQKHFSEYIDDRLSKNLKDVVEEHLGACLSCREELGVLQKVVGRVRDLPETRAPGDFIFRLNERLAPPSKLKTVLNYLTAPFRFKIPFGFATATAVAVVVIFMIQVKQTDKVITAPKTEAPSVEKLGRAGAQKTDAVLLPKTSEMAEAQSMKQAPTSTLLYEQGPDALQKEKTESKKGLKDLDMAAVPPTAMEKEAPREVIWELTVAPSAEADNDEKPVLKSEKKALPRFAARGSGFPSSENELSADVAEKENLDSGEGVQHLYADNDKAFNYIETLVIQLGGGVVSREQKQSPGREERLILSIPAEKVKEFYTKLGEIGRLNVRKEEVPEYQKGKDPVTIQLKLIPL